MDRPALTREESREVDRHAIEQLGYPGIVLMENAGRGCVDVIDGLGAAGPVLVVCGRGNNAGDGFVIARHLTLRGTECRVVLASDPAALTGDALLAYQMMQPCGVPTLALYEKPAEAINTELAGFSAGCDLLIDALLGTGASGDPRPPYDTVIAWLNEQPAMRLAIDVPSGLDCDSGAAGEPTVRADHTCTFVAPKTGFLVDRASWFLGQLHVVGIGLPTEHSRTTDFGVRRNGDADRFDGPRSPSYDASSGIWSQIALTIRQRPLVAPLLAATASVDLVLLALNNRLSAFDEWIFWGVLAPQLGLLAIWLAMSLRHWVIKLVLSGLLAGLFSAVIIHDMGSPDFAEVLTIFFVYFAAIFASTLLFRLLIGHLGRTGDPLRFSTWHLIVTMTVVAFFAALARHAAWPISNNDIPIFLGIIAIPIITHIAFWVLAPAWRSWAVSLFVGALFEWGGYHSASGHISGFFLCPVLVCGLWLTAIRVQPDARRRLAARRLRRQPKLAVVAPHADAPPPEEPAAPSTIDTTT